MIQVLSTRYQKVSAGFFLALFYLSVVIPAHAGGRARNLTALNILPAVVNKSIKSPLVPGNKKDIRSGLENTATGPDSRPSKLIPNRLITQSTKFIDGPSQPEMTSFKPAGADNMVNLFTGDFSYNIPLLDVGGYPVNIFYNGNIGMEQEASWVGLGWNINPGTITRNMRGVPDDFNGEDELVETKIIKPNKTFGVRLGPDFEFAGVKKLFSADLSVTFNNYLGPALDLGIKGSLNSQVANITIPEKSASIPLMLKTSIAANLSSRNGLTLSPSASLSATMFFKERKASFGPSLSTSYNSRSGIKEMQLSEQMSLERDRLVMGHKDNITTANFKHSSISTNISSSTINFAKPTYLPTIRMPLMNTAWSGHFQLGGGISGAFTSAEMEVFSQKSEIDPANPTLKKPLIGYLYFEQAAGDPNAIMDFSRLNDKEVTPKTPIISAPQYAYDVFAIQGEGTGGTFRAYRDDLGYVRDNVTGSQDKSIAVGADIGIPGHYGANVNVIRTPTTIGEWGDGNKLSSAMAFSSGSQLRENVYFRNPGETSVLHPNQFDRIGGTDLVSFKLGGPASVPTIEPVLQRYSKDGYPSSTVNVATTASITERKKRSQVINILTAADFKGCLDKEIKNYNSSQVISNGLLNYDAINRLGGNRKAHHISQINITEADGKRYIYGIPVYNTSQKDFTFSVPATDPDADKFDLTNNEDLMTKASHLINSGGLGSPDGYVQITETPAYAHSFLLSGLISPDYVDVKGDGISEDDLGTAIKYNYTYTGLHSWRTPLSSPKEANLNVGNRSENKDDKGIVSFGERESWYLHSIESKSMIALFVLEDRNDGKGASGVTGGVNVNDKTVKRLKQIDLYNKADIKANGLTGPNAAKPIKTVHFGYSYRLCQGTPDNLTNDAQLGKGKLTLENIWFTYNGQNRQNLNQYKFDYTSNNNYAFNASDRWTTYKPYTSNPAGIRNKDYPYSLQENSTITKANINANAASWALNKILLPSGGQIEVEYESDDYAFVQNRRAADMFQVVGFGKDENVNNKIDRLYALNGLGQVIQNNYAFVKVPVGVTAAQVKNIYLDGLEQFAFRYYVIMPKGIGEYLTCYADLDNDNGPAYGVTTDNTIIWLKLKPVDGVSPLALTAMEYLREQLPGQAFPGYDVSEQSDVQKIGAMMIGWLSSLKNIFTGPIEAFESEMKASKVDLPKCFVRLNDPDGFKFGGGSRVKSVKLKDNWKAMTGQFTSTYGQTYEYTTTENFNGTERTISSGVASYEPSVGGEENPFQNILHVKNQIPLGPASYGSIEMPVLDAFFPTASVGYSKVTVRAIRSTAATEAATGRKSRSGIGKQITQFYTAKDYPVYYSYTDIKDDNDKQVHVGSSQNFFYKYAFDSRAISQGFLVETNDMHGKIKSQSSYAENDENTRVNYSEYNYRNTGRKGLNEKFDFVSGKGGYVSQGNMGIDIDLMTDSRKFSVKGISTEVQGQLDFFPVIINWLPFIWPVIGNSENTYRAVTTTKVVNYHGILESVTVVDKGSTVTTTDLAYDSETGAVVVNRTNNEFNQFIYNTSYPAYWAYSGMGPAYKNIDAIYSGVSFSDGRIVGTFDQSVFESGDELLISDGDAPVGDCHVSTDEEKVWVYDINKDNTSLGGPHNFIFLTKEGKIYTRANVKFRIVRSGKRNMLSANASTIVSFINPVQTDPLDNSKRKFILGTNSNVTNASAMEYKEKWQTDNDVIKTVKDAPDPNNQCGKIQVEDCDGYLEKNINPYNKGLLGTFRPYRSMVFYEARKEGRPATQGADFAATNLSKNGFFNSFKPYWDFDASGNLMPDANNAQWVWNNQSTRFNAKGMELENKNALNIFTSAQYGYNNTLPIAITNNAAYSEMAYEGFEDSYYNENLHAAPSLNCAAKKHMNLPMSSSSGVIKASSAGFKAHSGDYVMQLNNGAYVAAQVNVGNDGDTDFPLNVGTSNALALADPGGNTTVKAAIPTNVLSNSSINMQTTSNVFMDIIPVDLNPDGSRFHRYDIDWYYYVEIPETNVYWFDMSFVTMYNDFANKQPGYNNAMSMEILDLDGENVTLNMNGQTVYKAQISYTEDSKEYPAKSSGSFSAMLCKGIYKIKGNCLEMYGGTSNTRNTYSWDWRAGAKNAYKTLATTATCPYTTPIAGSQAMLNPVATIPTEKDMWFSCWVRSDCNGSAGPCPPATYDVNNNIQVQLYGGSSYTFIPTGPVIDGWQKIEGKFRLPTGTSFFSIQLANGGSLPIYFDDIRIHPFTANMKNYVYDPINLRLTAELDANNYATFYDYDEEGTLIRTRAETQEGIKTINETRSAKQKLITSFQ